MSHLVPVPRPSAEAGEPCAATGGDDSGAVAGGNGEGCKGWGGVGTGGVVLGAVNVGAQALEGDGSEAATGAAAGAAVGDEAGVGGEGGGSVLKTPPATVVEEGGTELKRGTRKKEGRGKEACGGQGASASEDARVGDGVAPVLVYLPLVKNEGVDADLDPLDTPWCDLFEFAYQAQHVRRLLQLAEANVEQSRDQILGALACVLERKKALAAAAGRAR